MRVTKRILSLWVFVAGMLLLSSFALADGRVLEMGSKGAEVTELQEQLNQLGYSVTVDGKFGANTKQSVQTFQKARGIRADGIVGLETREVLRNALEKAIHVVSKGDSLYLLSKSYGVSVSDIMALNELTDSTIYVGQELIIPQVGVQVVAPPETMVYKVKPGENASVIAKRFNTSVVELVSANQLQDPNRLAVGQELVIPTVSSRGSGDSFIWPVMGRISSKFGWRIHPIYKNKQFHGGIDIAVPSGTHVRAAASGVVVQSGWLGGFGYGIQIDHGSGFSTWYGHNSDLLVSAGQRVQRGQLIAKSGSTGVSTGPHLDFRVKVNGEAVDPMLWLPR